VRIRGVDRRPARTGRRPRSALRWIRSLSCAGTLSGTEVIYSIAHKPVKGY
jgi:hypothetical protein